jgi:hypothetical protein
MHQLTIDTTALTVTEHDGPDAAHAALLAYAVKGDYYLRALPTVDQETRYQLLILDDTAPVGPRPRQPRVAGTAVIDGLPASTEPGSGPYFAACEAPRWIRDAAANRDRHKLSNPYPDAVLTIAQGAARGRMHHDLLACESAALAAHADAARPDPTTLEALRHNAITAPTADVNPAQLAAAVQQHLSPGCCERTSATLVWFYALILWGAHA